jgi:hypothetical protein
MVRRFSMADRTISTGRSSRRPASDSGSRRRNGRPFRVCHGGESATRRNSPARRPSLYLGHEEEPVWSARARGSVQHHHAYGGRDPCRAAS